MWKIAWPTVLQNAIGGLQGIIDHALVGHFVGFTANAAIGVSWQIFLVVIVFISSLFTGMGVLVSRFAGANNHEMVDRTVYQAFLTAFMLSVGILAPLGYVACPVSPRAGERDSREVRAEALPFLRIMFLFSIGMLMFFMLGGALRAAGDARTGLYLGVAMTVLNISLNVVLIRGAGPIPAFGTKGAAMGTVIASTLVSATAIWMILAGKLVIHFPRMSRKPDWAIIRSLFKFGLPAGFQGVAMNIAGVLMLRFIGSLEHSAEAQAAFAVGYAELFSLITWTSVGLMGAAAAVAGQNLGAGRPERSERAVHLAARVGLVVAGSSARSSC